MAQRDSKLTELKPLIKEDGKSREESGSLILYISTAIVLLGAMAVGTMLGLTSPFLPSLHKMGPESSVYLNRMQASWFGACVTPAAVFGAYIAGFIMQGIGRKYTSVLSGIPFVVGLLLISFAQQIWMLFVGRVITGLGVGIISLIVPTYIGETSTAKFRGMLGSANQLCIVSGILFIYGVGSVLSWRLLALAAMAPAALLTILSFFIPETPTFLVMKNKHEAAKASLTKLRSSNSNIEDEFIELEKSLKSGEFQASWLEILKDSSLRTPVLLSLAAMYFQQGSGINCCMFYAKSIFMNAGFTSPSQLTVALLSVASAQVFFTIVSCLLIDKTGRKILLIIGAVVMTLSLVSFGLYFQLISKASYHQATANVTAAMGTMENVTSTTASPANSSGSGNLTWMAMVSMVVFISGYSIGIGPIAWLLVGEIIPARAKERAAGLSTAFNYLLVFILTLEFSNMLVVFTPQGTFWIFAGNCALSIIFTVMVMPETKGKTLEEIEIYFRNGKF